MKTLKSFLTIAALAVTLVGCRQDGLDYSKVTAQTGGPEQGQWRDMNGTLLSLDSGKFTYTKKGVTTMGTYKVANGVITFDGSFGSMTASWPDANSSITLEGSALTKTD